MKQLNILVVEDDALIALFLGEVLRGMGHVVSATEGTQDGAIAAALRCTPDLMIVDEHLGQGSGLAVVEQVVRRSPIPYVLVSGDTLRIRRLMPDAVILEKPYPETELARSIRRAMDRKSNAAAGGSPNSNSDDVQSRSPAGSPCADR